MHDEHTHHRLKPLFGWSLVLILAGGGAVLGALVAGYAGLRLAEAIVPLPSESSVVKQSLMPVLRLAICFSLAGAVIGFLLTFLAAKRLLDDRLPRTATRFAMAVLPSVAVVFIMAGMGVRWYLISRDLDAELAKIRAAGEPTCAADLSWYRPASPAELENGEAFLKAFSLLDRDVDSQCPIRLHNPPSDENMWPDIEGAEPLLQRNEQCLNLLHAAAARTGGTRYPLVSNGRNPVPIPDPDDRAYTAARLLALEACIRESHGDGRGAGQAIQAIFALASSFENEPDIFSYGTRASCERLASETLVSLLPCGDMSSEDLDRFKASLSRPDRLEGLYRAMVGWRMVPIGIMQRMTSSEMSPIWGLGSVVKAEQRADLVRYLRYDAQLLQCIKRPWPESAQTEKKLRDDLRAAYGHSRYGEIFYPLTSNQPRLMNQFLAEPLKADARAQATRILISVEQYRRRNKCLPETIDGLIPQYLSEIPKDPFADHPLRFLREGKEAVAIYSVGPDGTADHPQNDDIFVRMDYSAENAVVAKRRAKGAE